MWSVVRIGKHQKLELLDREGEISSKMLTDPGENMDNIHEEIFLKIQQLIKN